MSQMFTDADIDNALNQQMVFVISDFWRKDKATRITPTSVGALSTFQHLARQVALQPDILAAFVDRSPNSSGWLGIFDRTFAQILGVNTEQSTSQFSFNWHEESELQNPNLDDSNLPVLDLMQELISIYHPDFQIPCWFTGIPCTQKEHVYYDLILIGDRRYSSDVSMSQLTRIQKGLG